MLPLLSWVQELSRFFSLLLAPPAQEGDSVANFQAGNSRLGDGSRSGAGPLLDLLGHLPSWGGGLQCRIDPLGPQSVGLPSLPIPWDSKQLCHCQKEMALGLKNGWQWLRSLPACRFSHCSWGVEHRQHGIDLALGIGPALQGRCVN